jgi:hypothetical protein
VCSRRGRGDGDHARGHGAGVVDVAVDGAVDVSATFVVDLDESTVSSFVDVDVDELESAIAA